MATKPLVKSPKGLAAYLALTKPGIVVGNVLNALAGVCFASLSYSARLDHILMMMVGLTLVIASACMINNCIDYRLDQKMPRTQKRPTALRTVDLRLATVIALVFLSQGSIALYKISPLTAMTAAIGFVLYVAVYSYLKYVTVYATHLGSLSGAIPPVVGYVAVSNAIDGISIWLFFLIALWQMPHFFAIALFRKKEYEAGGIPVLPVAYGDQETQKQLIIYIALLALCSFSLILVSPSMLLTAISIGIASTVWLIDSMRSKKALTPAKWGKRMFFDSLYLVLAILAVALIQIFF